MASKPVISIIGLGLTGTSMGLGLKQQDGNFEIVGHDKDPDATKSASRIGAVDRTSWNLYKAVEDAEMVVLATPLNELKELLSLLHDDLQEGCLVLAMANVMQPALDLGTAHLPENVHFVVAHPILSGIGGVLTPRNDLFDGAPFCLAASVETDPSALQLASDFVERVGASPLFMDIQEHDGLIAMVEQLPHILGAALLDSVSQSPSWVEGRRVAGRSFAQSTEMGRSPERLFHDIGANRENLLARVDQFQQALSEWRALLATDPDAKTKTAGDDGSSSAPLPKTTGKGDAETAEHPLMSALQRAFRTRETWETQAILKDWDAEPILETPSAGGFMQQMFFGNLFRGRGERVADAQEKTVAGKSEKDAK